MIETICVIMKIDKMVLVMVKKGRGELKITPTSLL
jgi:hypothetical protein